ncbi:integrase [Salipiger pallidus]|uniref:Integrase n=1 Tax=Salipiger pallidus TaxID=1775170 RepID=A0A8J3EF99_9RHOB|nr:site-specific integrase [Salipiger pallidus]GGG62883.1 integrase [Salipiger pallidus]
MARALTTKTVEALRPDPERRREIPDPALSGLYVVVQPSGAKSWALRYRFAGRPRKLTLGRWPILGLAAARAAATEALEELEAGRDPSAAKQAAKAKTLEAQLSDRDKVKTLFRLYSDRYLANLKSGATPRRELERHVVSRWGDRDIHDIAKRDVIDLLDEIADTGRVVSANRLRTYLSGFMNWCVARDVIDLSPVTGVKAIAKEISRDRVLSDDEIRWLWQACDDIGQPWGPLAKILLLTGQRLREVAEMTNTEISGDAWHLPASRTKNGKAHGVPISSEVHGVLASVARVPSAPGYLFTTTGTSPVSGYTKGHARLIERMAAIATGEAGEPFEIPRWTFHDLRRTAATGMARLGVPVRVTEAVLNHTSGTGGGLVGIYQRHDYGEEKRRALEAWARFVLDLVESKAASNVVHIGARQ